MSEYSTRSESDSDRRRTHRHANTISDIRYGTLRPLERLEEILAAGETPTEEQRRRAREAIDEAADAVDDVLEEIDAEE